jgi:hypothetical protein
LPCLIVHVLTADCTLLCWIARNTMVHDLHKKAVLHPLPRSMTMTPGLPRYSCF